MNIAALLGMSGLALIGAMALICFTKVYGICFLGTPRTEYHPPPSEKEVSLLIPMTILVILIIAIGVVPVISIALLAHVVGQFVPDVSHTLLPEIFSSMTTLSVTAAVFISLIIFFYSARTLLLRRKTGTTL